MKNKKKASYIADLMVKRGLIDESQRLSQEKIILGWSEESAEAFIETVSNLPAVEKDRDPDVLVIQQQINDSFKIGFGDN